jgi:hypothetical protein
MESGGMPVEYRHFPETRFGGAAQDFRPLFALSALGEQTEGDVTLTDRPVCGSL